MKPQPGPGGPGGADRRYVIRRPGAGTLTRTSDDRPMLVKVDAAETGGLFKVVEMTEAPRARIPVHEHDYPESWYVLEGTYLVWIDGAWHTAEAGTWVHVEPRVPHGIAATPGAPCRKLSIVFEGAASAPGGGPATLEMRPVAIVDVPGAGDGGRA